MAVRFGQWPHVLPVVSRATIEDIADDDLGAVLADLEANTPRPDPKSILVVFDRLELLYVTVFGRSELLNAVQDAALVLLTQSLQSFESLA